MRKNQQNYNLLFGFSVAPDNLEVKQILANLREGLPALEGIQPSQLPIEESPLERSP